MLAALPDLLDSETDETTFLRILTTVSNLMYKNAEATELASQLEITAKLPNTQRFKTEKFFDHMGKIAEDI